MQNALFIWIIIATILFALAVTATPPDNMDGVDIFWLAVLATTWPIILFVSVAGIAMTYLAELLKSR